MSDSFGTPTKPLDPKCAAIGRPEKNKAYLSIVTMDGRQFVFDLRMPLAKLLMAEAAAYVAAQE